MKDSKARTWHEWIEMNELTWSNWNEWLDMNELKWMNCKEWIGRNELPQECSDPTKFFTIFMWNRALPQSCAHILSFSSSKSAPRPSVFFCVFDCFCVINYLMMMWLTYKIELSLQFRANVVDLILKKCSETVSFLTMFMWNRALATV